MWTGRHADLELSWRRALATHRLLPVEWCGGAGWTLRLRLRLSISLGLGRTYSWLRAVHGWGCPRLLLSRLLTGRTEHCAWQIRYISCCPGRLGAVHGAGG